MFPIEWSSGVVLADVLPEVLDGGIHFVAGLRLLLGSDNVSRLSAFTSQLQKHLPPIDTVDATMKTKSGATGTVSISFGTTLTGSEWTFGCEGGSVSLSKGMELQEFGLVAPSIKVVA